jgi:radical SAM superfamily enzyme with C-terminal helix-hairpin-helix motif
MASQRITIVDGFIDEPSIFGVPPYIAPQMRSTAGAIMEAADERGIDIDLRYQTIEDTRHDPSLRRRALDSDLLVMVTGALVPGKYLRGHPISVREIQQLAEGCRGTAVLGGPISYAVDKKDIRHVDIFADGDVDAALKALLSGDASKRLRVVQHSDQRSILGMRSFQEWHRWLLRGASIVRQHPDFPEPLFAEIETYKGCVRYMNGGCAFCSDVRYGVPKFRTPDMVAEEMRALAALGVRHFRIGGQTCIYCYGSREVGVSETPKINPEAIFDLFCAAREAAGPELKVLHVDNANPAVMATHPEEAQRATEHLVDLCTAGNIVAFGLETVDPAVFAANNLNSTPDQVITAATIVNKYGRTRGPNGMPKLLPGLNFVCGLDGETQTSYAMNLEFLRELKRRGLLFRRINIRQVNPVRRPFQMRVPKETFRRFKEQVRTEFDHPWLEEVAPVGTVLTQVFTEVRDGGLTLARQVGTYALLVGLVEEIPLRSWLDAVVVGHGYRSVAALRHPIDVNNLPLRALEQLPGVGRKRAARLAVKRPFATFEDIQRALDEPALLAGLEGKIAFNPTARRKGPSPRATVSSSRA